MQSWVVGKDPSCDIVVDRPNISRRHCRLVREGNQYYVEDLQSTNGTYVNGQLVEGQVAVTQHDAILLGSNVPLPWPTDTVAPVAIVPSYQPTPATAPGVPGAERTIQIGRDPDNHVVLPFPMVSGRHARIRLVGGQAILEDLGSTNGTSVNAPGQRISCTPLKPDDIVYFGSLRVPSARLLAPVPTVGDQPQRNLAFSGRELVLGRHATCDRVLDYPMISQRHLRIYRSGSQLMVEDLGSANGSFVNGQRITKPTSIQLGDVIGLGSYSFKLTADGQFEQRDHRGNVTIEAHNISVEVPGKRLLQQVSLTIHPSEFVGLMGPSGAGKTTLMNVLNGYTPPSEGRVLFNGQDLYRNYAQFGCSLGYVPQDDIIHRDLTVGQALHYTARLRFPPDMSDGEIDERIRKTLKELGLEGTENVLIGSPEKKGISGGQRKRVNLAMELLTDPSVLFLDEPTSGLSSEDALTVMKVLRRLADCGKAILLTIHQPSLEAFRLMDNLVLVGKDLNSKEPGVLVYYGPAYPDAVHFFNPEGVADLRPGVDPSPDEVLRGLSKRPTRAWTETYHQSRYRREYVNERSGKSREAAPEGQRSTSRRANALQQWWILVQRYLIIKAKDHWNTAILLAQAPIVAILVVLVFGKETNQEVSPANWASVANTVCVTVFLMGLSALWFGCSNAAREIVGEWAIYHRERMVNLKLTSYLGSKLAVLSALCILQCVTLLTIVHWGCGLQASWFGLLLPLLLVAGVGVAIGLTLSAVARTSEVAIALLPIVLLPMVILGGVMQPTHKMRSVMRGLALAAPSRWAFETMLILEAEQRPRAPALPIGAGIQPLSEGDGEKSLSQKAEPPDIAEQYFPTGKRSNPNVGLCGLTIMFVLLCASTLLILRSRDVH